MLQFGITSQPINTLCDEEDWNELAGLEEPPALDHTLQEDRESMDSEEKDEPGNLEIEQLLYREIGTAPLLEKTQERHLTQRARAAWQGLLACLRKHQGLFPGEWTDEKALDRVSERDVVWLIEQLQIRLQKAQADAPATSRATAQLAECLALLQHHLADFRQSRDELVRRNLRLVARVARYYRGRGLVYLDLIQEGTFGLMRAIEKFDPSKEVRFATYALWWIRQAMTSAQTQHGCVIRLPATLQAHRRRRAQLRGTGEGAPDASLPSEAMPEVRVVSLDTPLGNGDARRLEELLSHSILSPEEAVVQGDRKRQLHTALAHLSPRQAAILRLRYGLAGSQPLTLEKIGTKFGVSPERVRQIEAQAHAQLRRLCQQEADAVSVASH